MLWLQVHNTHSWLLDNKFQSEGLCRPWHIPRLPWLSPCVHFLFLRQDLLLRRSQGRSQNPAREGMDDPWRPTGQGNPIHTESQASMEKGLCGPMEQETGSQYQQETQFAILGCLDHPSPSCSVGFSLGRLPRKVTVP